VFPHIFFASFPFLLLLFATSSIHMKHMTHKFC